MEQPLVSVIIPVYNVEQWFPYCMESVLAQTYRHIEIILVDDGSADGSGRMCDDYAKADSRIKVIHKANGGLSSARNTGIENMTGEYVVFIDSDDYVRTDYVQTLLKYALENKVDMVIGSYVKVTGNRPYDQISPVGAVRTYECRELQKNLLARRLPMYAHGKLYRARLFETVRFPEGKWYEDVPAVWEIAAQIKETVYLNAPLYFYRQRPDSIVNKKFTTGRMDQLYAAEQIYKETGSDAELNRIAASRCFFSAADNYAVATSDFPEEKKYLRNALRKYRGDVLKDRTAFGPLKLMALAACISPKFVGLIGRCYKWYNRRKHSVYYQRALNPPGSWYNRKRRKVK